MAITQRVYLVPDQRLTQIGFCNGAAYTVPERGAYEVSARISVYVSMRYIPSIKNLEASVYFKNGWNR